MIAKETYWDGIVHQIKPSETNLYWSGEDNPSELMTEEEMKVRIEEDGEDEIPEVYIKKR